jgi:folate-binding Fe-S cluster repair protein YgfZ
VPALILPDRSLIRVEGADAQHFLQNLITTNIDAIAPGEAWPAALLTPQGKILFDFLISKSGETGYDCDIRTDQAADFIRRLTLYKLRASVQFNRLEDQPVIAAGMKTRRGERCGIAGFPKKPMSGGCMAPEPYLMASRPTGMRSGSLTEWLNRARISHSRMCFPMTC